MIPMGSGLEDADGTSAAAGLVVVLQQPEIGLYQRLVESARKGLAELELEYGEMGSVCKS